MNHGLENFLHPFAGLALTSNASLALMPMTSSISCMARSGLADGRSILLSTAPLYALFDGGVAVGDGLRLHPLACVHHSSAPSHAASERDTSYEKSTCRECR